MFCIPQLQLETNNGVRFANYTGMTGNILTFEYTIVAGDFTTDLDYLSTGALTGVIYATGTTDNAILTLPVPGAQFSLGFNKAIEISTVVITDTYDPGDATDQLPIRFTVTFDMPVAGFNDPLTDVVTLGTANITNVLITPANLGMTEFYVDVTVNSNGTVQIEIPFDAAQSVAGGISNEPSLPSHLITFTAPAPTVLVAPAALQLNPTTALPINFTVAFSEDVFGFDENGITLGGTAAGVATVMADQLFTMLQLMD